MTDLRKLARGKDCMLRIPLVCNHDRETTVLAHVRRGFYGMGTKPVDWCGVWACSACHDVYDERPPCETAMTTTESYGCDKHGEDAYQGCALCDLEALRERLHEAELVAASWKREAELNEQAANESSGYAKRLAEAEYAKAGLEGAVRIVDARVNKALNILDLIDTDGDDHYYSNGE